MRDTNDLHTARGTRWLGLAAADIMQKHVITVGDSAPLSEVERVLSENRISGVPVTDQSGRVLGVISMRDLLDRYAEEPEARPRRGPGYFRESTAELADADLESFDLPPESEETAGSLMTPEIYDVPSTAPVHEVAGKMAEHGIHRVLVTDATSRQVVGIITSMGILAAVSA